MSAEKSFSGLSDNEQQALRDGEHSEQVLPVGGGDLNALLDNFDIDDEQNAEKSHSESTESHSAHVPYSQDQEISSASSSNSVENSTTYILEEALSDLRAQLKKMEQQQVTLRELAFSKVEESRIQIETSKTLYKQGELARTAHKNLAKEFIKLKKDYREMEAKVSKADKDYNKAAGKTSGAMSVSADDVGDQLAPSSSSAQHVSKTKKTDRLFSDLKVKQQLLSNMKEGLNNIYESYQEKKADSVQFFKESREFAAKSRENFALSESYTSQSAILHKRCGDIVPIIAKLEQDLSAEKGRNQVKKQHEDKKLEEESMKDVKQARKDFAKEPLGKASFIQSILDQGPRSIQSAERSAGNLNLQ